jgi:hypothetical protein
MIGAQARRPLRVSRIAFFADGTFCGVIPESGFDGLDMNAERASFPDYWGTYTFANNKGTVTINGHSYPFELSDNTVTYDGVEFNLHYLSPDGSRFAGTFTQDGRFTDNGAISWMRHVRGYTEDQSDKVLGSGKYSIKNFTIIFDYADGRRIKMAFESLYGKDPKNPT